jgi:hypothetical protein
VLHLSELHTIQANTRTVYVGAGLAVLVLLFICKNPILAKVEAFVRSYQRKFHVNV